MVIYRDDVVDVLNVIKLHVADKVNRQLFYDFIVMSSFFVEKSVKNIFSPDFKTKGVGSIFSPETRKTIQQITKDLCAEVGVDFKDGSLPCLIDVTTPTNNLSIDENCLAFMKNFCDKMKVFSRYEKTLGGKNAFFDFLKSYVAPIFSTVAASNAVREISAAVNTFGEVKDMARLKELRDVKNIVYTFKQLSEAFYFFSNGALVRGSLLELD